MNVGRVEFGSKIIFCIQKCSWLCNKLSLHDYFSDTVPDSTMGGFMCFRNLKLDCTRDTQPHSFITSIFPSFYVTNYMRFHFLMHSKFTKTSVSREFRSAAAVQTQKGVKFFCNCRTPLPLGGTATILTSNF